MNSPSKIVRDIFLLFDEWEIEVPNFLLENFQTLEKFNFSKVATVKTSHQQTLQITEVFMIKASTIDIKRGKNMSFFIASCDFYLNHMNIYHN